MIDFLLDTASDLDLLTGIAARITVTFVLIVIVYGAYRRWWVPKWVYDEKTNQLESMRSEKDEWKEIALRSTNLAETMGQIRQYGGGRR